MSITISDPDVLAQLMSEEWVEVKDAVGRVIGIFQMEPSDTLTADEPIIQGQGQVHSPSDLIT